MPAVLFAEVLYGVSSDLSYMGRGVFGCNQYAVLVHAGHIQSTGTDVAKSNAVAHEVQAMYIRAGFGDLCSLNWR